MKIHDWGITSLHMDPNAAYHLAFAVACVSLILSIAIYYTFRPGFKHLEGNTKKKDEKSGAASEAEELSPAETKERIIALCLVFAVVIFFWMAFHQNGLTLTYFADEFVQPTAEGAQSMVFDVINLFMVIVIVYAGFAFFGAKTGKAKGISALVMLAALAVIVYKYSVVEGSVSVSAPIFQQFNPFYVVALTPVSMAIFGALARKGKEPTAPRKIAYGMLIAGCGFLVMLLLWDSTLLMHRRQLQKVQRHLHLQTGSLVLTLFLPSVSCCSALWVSHSYQKLLLQSTRVQ